MSDIGIVDRVRSWMYSWLLSADNPIATQHGYAKVLEALPKGARVLDVGVGDGIYFTNPKVVSLIKEKNFKIYGIDIDEGATKIAQRRVEKAGLQDYVACEGRDLLDLSVEKDGLFDSILFFESFPVIPRKLFRTLILHANSLLKPDATMFLYHVLEPYSSFIVRTFKPYLYYITTIDFGQECTIDDMKKYCDDWGFPESQRIIEPCLQTTYNNMWWPLGFIPTVKNWVITTYTTKLVKHF
eukprot:m.285782 g.285782  ORF g.285782 m.285782 type:complete len:241 (-) comp19917_c1_seq22:566-1288(-)